MFLKKICILGLLFFLCCLQAQEKSPQKRLEAVESRLLILEDYLKSRLNQLQKTIKEQEILITRLQEENNRFEKELKDYQEKIKRAEEEILHLKAALSSIIRTDELSETTKPEKAIEKEKTRPSSSLYSYKDQQIIEWAARFQSPVASIRMDVVLDLSKSDKEEADLLLIKALEDQDRYIKMLTLKALVKRKSRAAVYPILSLIPKEKAETASLFLDALQAITMISEPFPVQGSKEEKQSAIKRWKEKLQKAGF